MSRTAAIEESAPGGARRLAVNFVLLTGGECLAKLATFAAFSYLGHTLGPERYGSLEFVIAAMAFFTLPVDLGLGIFGAREIARDPQHAPALLRDVTAMRALLAGCSFAVLCVVAACIPQSAECRQLLLIYGISLFAAPALIEWFFQGHDLMHWVAAASIIRKASFAVLVFAVFQQSTPLYLLGVFECLSAAAAAAFCLAVLRLRRRPAVAAPPFRWSVLRERLRASSPIGFSELSWAFLWYFPTVFLGFLAADASVGWYGATHRIVIALHTFVWLYFFNLLPSISRRTKRPRGELVRLLRGSLVPTCWGGLFVVLVATLLGRPILGAVYGEGFAAASPLLTVLIWLIPVTLVSGHYRYNLIAHGFQRVEFHCTLVAGVACLALLVALTPRFGAIGAAVALLAGNVLNLAVACRQSQRLVTRVPFLPALAPPLVAMLAGLGLAAGLPRTLPLLPALAAALLYLGALLVWNRGPLVALCVAARSPQRNASQPLIEKAQS